MEIKPEHLDPQQKAAYDRVMGTATPPTPTATPPQASTPAPVVAGDKKPEIVVGHKDAGETKVVAGGAKGKGLSPILIGIVAVLFFLIYTLVWLMVFGIKIPFLPS